MTPNLQITISNVGNRIATIKNISWEIQSKSMKKKQFSSIHLFDGNDITLTEGEEHKKKINYLENEWLSDTTKLINGYFARDLKLVVSTIQDTFKFDIDETLINEILQERKNLGLSN